MKYLPNAEMYNALANMFHSAGMNIRDFNMEKTPMPLQANQVRVFRGRDEGIPDEILDGQKTRSFIDKMQLK